MPRPRTAMRKIREVLRLHLGEGLSPRQVAASLSLPRITVRRYLQQAHLAGVVWPLPEGMDDERLERRLFAPPPPPSAKRPLPDWPVVHQELRRKEVTLQLLWLLCRCRHNSHYADLAFMPTWRIGEIGNCH